MDDTKFGLLVPGSLQGVGVTSSMRINRQAFVRRVPVVAVVIPDPTCLVQLRKALADFVLKVPKMPSIVSMPSEQVSLIMPVNFSSS